MVNWKAPGANDRLMGALLAAHTEFKPNYHKIATVFGQGATYNSVEAQFRKYRKIADNLAKGAQENASSSNNNAARPKNATPRSSQTNGITKSSGSGKRAASTAKRDNGQKSPTKSGKAKKALLNAISLSETDSDGDFISSKSETATKGEEDGMAEAKVEGEKLGGVLAMGFGLVDSQTNGYVQGQEDDDDVFAEDA
ncbi:hypothetical protein PISL3812_06826 [Talaromyces islandicus]|uniref:Uncharacterized protein n=1 Tax=Talaromyces islandicus TaxID=28573 RepID=A0A0U1M2H1_TALIS|nr:hypothetical protein PISL3812_06826 [Talaromyces islandicus]